MLVKIKRLHSSAIIPYYSRPGDAAMDLYATNVDYDKYGNLISSLIYCEDPIGSPQLGWGY